MIRQVTLFLGIIITASCTLLHQIPTATAFNNYGIQPYGSDPSYDFAYDVNDPYTGDVKNQAEAKRGDVVSGQYSLLQPDGVHRVVDYRADSYNGFRATVNDNGNRNVPANDRHDQQVLSRENTIDREENLRRTYSNHGNSLTNGNTHNGALTQPTITRNVVIHPLPTPDPWNPVVWRR
ncbi:Cuticle protein 19 [Eumeta japonica]|uniref:Cuticle protein 19 n=1 Tax=Eumeta variegata TaxID=151549 RepID=A0A4C1YKD0_EUMVA|nr:Cuticle protein 19 [Eumeta japonica]